MNLKEIADLKRQKQYLRITQEFDGKDPLDIEDEDIRLLIAEVYLEDEQYEKSVLWYWKCLETDPEECVRKLIYILKNIGDADALEQLRDDLNELGEDEGFIALCEYEVLRISGGTPRKLIEPLKKYIEEENDPAYLIRLAELYLLEGNEEAATQAITKCIYQYPCSDYAERADVLKKEMQDGNAVSYVQQHSIDSDIYQMLKGNEVSVNKKESPEINEKKKISLLDKLGKKSTKRKKYRHESSVNIEEAFEQICGMKEIQDALGNLYRMLQIEQARNEKDIKQSLLVNTNFTIAGGKATGKTLLATTIHQILYAFGVRDAELPELLEARDLEGAFSSLMEAEDRTIIIENIEKCANQEGIYDSERILWPLEKLLDRKKASLSVIITGSEEGMNALFAQSPGLKKDIYKSFTITPYTLEEFMEICNSMAQERGFYIDDGAKLYIRKLISRNYKKTGFTNAAFLADLLTRAISNMADRVSAQGYEKDLDVATLICDDFLCDDDNELKIQEALKELDELIGLNSVKEVVLNKINELNIRQEEEEQGIENKRNASSRHLVFYGNPGTGKTTVARIIGKIYYYLGILPEQKFVECSAGDLIAEHVGGTAVKTRAKIAEAIGGILFIDEAYGLASDKGQFNDQAVDELVKQMEDHKDELMVILAGYKDDMEHFFKNTNVGLMGRFPQQNRIIFEDYDPGELQQIFLTYVANAGLTVEEGCEELVALLLEEKAKEDGFHNARGVRNVYEHVTNAMNNRLIDQEHKTREDYIRISRSDLEEVLQDHPKDKRDKDALLRELDSMTGLASVKKEVRTLVKKLEASVFFAERDGGKEKIVVDNMLFLGNPGTGKTTVARIFSQILEELGILRRKGHFIEATRDSFVSKIVGESAEKTRKLVESAYGGVLFIDEAYALYEDQNDSYGKEAINTLLKMMEDHREELIVIAAGYRKEMGEFLESNSGLMSRFPLTIDFEDYTTEELYQILLQMLQKNHYRLEESCKEAIETYFDHVRMEKNFGNARVVRNLYQKLVDAAKIRIYEEMKNDNVHRVTGKLTITQEDFLEVTGQGQEMAQETVQELLEQIDAMIGLEQVKKEVHELIQFIQGIRQRKGENADVAKELGRMHMVFQGPPGTGKTTIARIIGKLYYRLGILRKDVFIECDRSSFVAGYVGQSEEKTNRVIDSAMGGVLYIDEAYALAGDGQDFGKQVVNVLLKRMEDQRHDFVVILSGYTEDMQKLFELNQGFVSRVPNAFHFESYSTEELLQIFEWNAEREAMKLNEDGLHYLREYFELIRREPGFANARDVENTFEKIKRKVIQKMGQNIPFDMEDDKTIITEEIILEAIGG